MTSLSDCIHRHEAVVELPNLSIEHIVVAPGSGKASNPKIGATSGAVVSWCARGTCVYSTVGKSVIVNGRPLTMIARDAGDKGCILREDWDNTQASVDTEK